MQGDFKLYDTSFAETSKTGWYELYKSAPREWTILECFSDGSCSKRTFENSLSTARTIVDKLNYKHKCEVPYHFDHGVKYPHEVTA